MPGSERIVTTSVWVLVGPASTTLITALGECWGSDAGIPLVIPGSYEVIPLVIPDSMRLFPFLYQVL